MHNRFDDTPTKLGIILQEKKKKEFENWLTPLLIVIKIEVLRERLG
ncbi:hypothetical protein RR45_GL000179 [Lactococcus chungangensis CAU 28 = DSM 22330]|uniref:Uncharacterized protein n=2 Tax=Pseudolactococcus chungangensis CAU 28 = DSM 22330 TaxID=1122154 RepID=A0ABX4I9V9_9LACT|nr:hypothetical protein RR45_GL000179 [Lactococcus chungangensis CAU 28 = DSM 22330]